MVRTKTPRDHRHYWARRYRRIDNEGLCIYCGDPSEVLDHFLPVSRAADYSDGHVLVDACSSCNGIASDKVFQTVEDKMKYIHLKLRKKYRRALQTQGWEDDELDELEYVLLSAIQKIERLKSRVNARLTWRNRDNPAYSELASIVVRR